MSSATSRKRELTPVDDVRRVRKALDRQVKGDIDKLVAMANRTAQKYQKKLRLKIVKAPRSRLGMTH